MIIDATGQIWRVITSNYGNGVWEGARVASECPGEDVPLYMPGFGTFFIRFEPDVAPVEMVDTTA